MPVTFIILINMSVIYISIFGILWPIKANYLYYETII